MIYVNEKNSLISTQITLNLTDYPVDYPLLPLNILPGKVVVVLKKLQGDKLEIVKLPLCTSFPICMLKHTSEVMCAGRPVKYLGYQNEAPHG